MNKSVFRLGRYYALNAAIIGMILCIYLLTANTDVHSVMGRAGVSPFYRGDSANRQVALYMRVETDDTAMVQRAMDVLVSTGTPATFFVDRAFAAAHPGTVRMLSQNGFEIGGAGLEGVRAEGLRKELALTDRALNECTGAPVSLYSPPDGEYSRETLDVAAALGYTTVLWSVDASGQDADTVLTRAVGNLYNGAIIRVTVDGPTIEALPAIVKAVKEKDYEFETVGTLIQ